jgi:hypothetical protein
MLRSCKSLPAHLVQVEAGPALPRHPTWLLSRWGINAKELSALLAAAAKLEQQATGPKSLSEPPVPWEDTTDQQQVRHKHSNVDVNILS